MNFLYRFPECFYDGPVAIQTVHACKGFTLNFDMEMAFSLPTCVFVRRRPGVARMFRGLVNNFQLRRSVFLCQFFLDCRRDNAHCVQSLNYLNT